ncbi:MAG TPA: hypothetical protein VII53_00995 [Solirubrobacteraceae bacterium]
MGAAQPLTANANTGSSHHTATAAGAIPRSLRLAASGSTKADRTLVAKAKTLKQCLSQHPKHPNTCQAERRALQQAGSKLALAEQRLAKAARSTGRRRGSRDRAHGSRRASALHAPQLTVSDQTLTWTRIAHVRSYALERKVPGQAVQYSVINGTSVTPPPVPGATVGYSVRTAVNGSTWSAERSIAYPPPTETVDDQAAPALTVSGQTLTWNQVGGVSTYVLMQRAPGQADQYSAVGGASFTPTPVPGATVYYSIRTAVDGSAWAPEVSITFPTATPTPPTSSPPVSESPTSSPPVSKNPTNPPPVSENPATPPVSTSSTGPFEMALVPGSLARTEPGIISQLGAHSVRMEFEVGASPSTLAPIVEEYAKVGIRIMPLAGFEGTLPTSAQAKNLASWAAEFGPGGTFWQGKSFPAGTAMTNVEFGNETSYTYQFSDNSKEAVANRAQTYALRFKEAEEGIHAANPDVGLLAQGDSGENNGSTWVDNMFKAVPNLAQLVAGWTVHPYGTESLRRIDEVVTQTQADGAPSTIPIYVTEWGLSTANGRCLSDNYGWNPCMTYEEAGADLASTVAAMRERFGSRLRALYLYQAQDLASSGTSTDREEHFGVLQYNGARKGAYTTEVESLLTANP